MEKDTFVNAIKKLREVSPKRNFTQSIDIIINLKGIDPKKQDQKIDTYIILPYSKGKPVKICALVGPELILQSKTVFDKTISNEEFQNYNNKKLLKKLATEYDFFIAQANLMGQIATTFGKTLGPRGKMPNPKAGCVVPETAQLNPLKEKLQKTIHIQTKNDASLKTSIGIESMDDEQLSENAYHSYNSIIHLLPQEKNNVKSIILKTTMGPAIYITDKSKNPKEDQKEVKKSKTKNEA